MAAEPLVTATSVTVRSVDWSGRLGGRQWRGWEAKLAAHALFKFCAFNGCVVRVILTPALTWQRRNYWLRWQQR